MLTQIGNLFLALGSMSGRNSDIISLLKIKVTWLQKKSGLARGEENQIKSYFNCFSCFFQPQYLFNPFEFKCSNAFWNLMLTWIGFSMPDVVCVIVTAVFQYCLVGCWLFVDLRLFFIVVFPRTLMCLILPQVSRYCWRLSLWWWGYCRRK